MKNLLISKVESVKFYMVDYFNNPVNVRHIITFCVGSGRHEGNVVRDIRFTMVDGTSIIWMYKDINTRNMEYREIKANFGHMLSEGGFWQGGNMISAKELGKKCDQACAEIDEIMQHDINKTCIEIETRMLNSIKKDPTKRFIKINSEYQEGRYIAFVNSTMRAAVKKRVEELGFTWREIGDRGINKNFEVTIGW